MKFSILLSAFILYSSILFAQGPGKISGTIVLKNSKEVAATVRIFSTGDTVALKTTATNKDGQFTFAGLSFGKYNLSVSSVGHETRKSPVLEISTQRQTIQIPPVELVPVSKSLVGVTVTSSRPAIEQRIDRTIVNVEASITNAGATALEVLEKSPGISVDRDGNISLKGKEGVLVLMDGRPTQLSGADLANLLRNMSASQMDQVEIMTNPPAKYDAAGNAGIINIKTKKTNTAGYTGSVAVNYVQGRYAKENTGFIFNYRSNKLNFFSNLSQGHRKQFGFSKINRNILNSNGNAIDNFFDQQANKIGDQDFYSARIGLDFFADKNTTFGIVVNGTSSPTTIETRNVTRISNSSKELESITKATVDNNSTWKSFSSNLNFRRLMDTKGKELTADLDFINYDSENRQFMVNSYTDANGNSAGTADSLQGYLPQHIRIYSGRIDYFHPIKKNMTFEAGLKSSIARTDNDALYDSILDGAIIRDVKRSNHFVYEENINAAYVNLSAPLSKKWTAQLGLRLENTNAKGKQLTTGENFERKYTQLFPTAFLQYKADDKNTFGINFGRRVRRPGYQSLNPFIRFIDRYTYSQGNPNLQPSLANSVELSHSWKNQLTTTLNYSVTNNIIDNVVQQIGQEAYTMPMNIASLKQFGIMVSANMPVTKWWSNNSSINVFHNTYSGFVSNAPISLSTTSFVIMTTQQFKINKNLTAEVNGRFRNGWLEGVMRVKPVTIINVGIGQQILKSKGTIRLGVRDLFFGQKFRGVSRYGNVDYSMEDINDTRVVSLGFTYRFSKGKKIAPVKRTAGSAADENDRIEN